MKDFKEVLIVAGTHGNELSGLYIEKLIRDKQLNVQRESFTIDTLVANSDAIVNNVRFVETDLNRQFGNEEQQLPHSKEKKIAQQLQLKYKNKPKQLVIDLHNTTSRMGATLILLARTPYYERMGAYVKKCMPQANILFENESNWQEHPYLCTMTGSGVMIEVEEQSHGVLTHQSLLLMKKLLLSVLDFIDYENQGLSLSLKDYEAYQLTGEVSFPLDKDGMRLAAVHPTICGLDFTEVKKGEPLLSAFNGLDLYWHGKQSTYPHFINEAAYSTKHIAMALADKINICCTG